MEVLILLLLTALTSVLVHGTVHGIFASIVRRRKTVVNEPAARDKPTSGEDRDKYNGPIRIFVPGVLAKWPWPRRINTHYDVVKEESDAWIKSFQAFSPKAQDAFIRCNSSLLACLAYPTASKARVRAGSDLMHVLFVIDEYSDKFSPPEVRKQKDVVMDALRNPHTPRPKGEWTGGEIVRQFWELTIQNATAQAQKRFIQSMEEYLEAVIQESTDKRDHRVLDIKGYIDVRRRTSASKVVFCIIELELNIPDEVMAHPAIQEMFFAAIDLVAVSNDIVSYNMEQRRGDDLHNLITCVMHEHRTDVNGAMLWVEDFLFGVQERFHAAKATLPQWEEPLNSQVIAYCDGLGQWVRATDAWSYESERYFGNKGLEIKENKWMSLLPKKHTTEIGPLHIDSSML